jgi:hypothetical protein
MAISIYYPCHPMRIIISQILLIVFQVLWTNRYVQNDYEFIDSYSTIDLFLIIIKGYMDTLCRKRLYNKYICQCLLNSIRLICVL